MQLCREGRLTHARWNVKLADVTKYAVDGETYESAAGVVKGLKLLDAKKAGKTDCKAFLLRKAC